MLDAIQQAHFDLTNPPPIQENQNAVQPVSTPVVALYIKVQNGQTVDHPVLPDNLQAVFGGVPSEYEPFMRFAQSERTPLKVFEVLDETVHPYTKVNGIWTDVYARRAMTAEERGTKEDHIRKFCTETLGKMTQYLVDKKDKATANDEIEFWEFQIQKFNAWTFDDLENPVYPIVPAVLKRDENGNIVSVDDSGSAPNVIG